MVANVMGSRNSLILQAIDVVIHFEYLMHTTTAVGLGECNPNFCFMSNAVCEH